MTSFLRLHPTDNVVVAVNGLSPGDIVDDVKITRRIPPGHKAAVRPIAKDQPALKFGQIIGFATQDIAPGDLLLIRQGDVPDVVALVTGSGLRELGALPPRDPIAMPASISAFDLDRLVPNRS